MRIHKRIDLRQKNKELLDLSNRQIDGECGELLRSGRKCTKLATDTVRGRPICRTCMRSLLQELELGPAPRRRTFNPSTGVTVNPADTDSEMEDENP